MVQLGTCCGSDPKVGLADWVKAQEAGGIVAIDTHAPAPPLRAAAHPALWPRVGGRGLTDAGCLLWSRRAYGYKDQPAIASGLKALGKERKDVWLTTKIPPGVFCKAAVRSPHHHPDTHPPGGPFFPLRVATVATATSPTSRRLSAPSGIVSTRGFRCAPAGPRGICALAHPR